MDELNDFIKSTKARIEAVIKRLNWKEEDFHSISKEKEDETKTGFTSDEEPTLPPSYSDTNSIVLDEEELQRLLGRKTKVQRFSDFQINFSREEKLMLYEHVVKQKKIDPTKQAEKELVSFGDIVAMKKREKTKRRKYRISKPTQSEEVRSVIELQMQALQHYLETNHKNKIDKNSVQKEVEGRYRSKGDADETEKDYGAYRGRDNERNLSEKSPVENYDRRKQRIVDRETEKNVHGRYSDDRLRPERGSERYRSRSRSRSRQRRRRRSRDRSRSKHKSKNNSRRKSAKRKTNKEKDKRHHS